WADRQWTEEFALLVENATGLLLFIHPNCPNSPVTIADLNSTLDAPEGGANDEAAPEQAQGEAQDIQSEEDFDAKKVSTQPIVIDQLQCIMRMSRSHPRLKVSVVVSAWDVIKKRSEDTPREWMRKNVSLLYQFLASNVPAISARYFGVSAQGGDYENEAERLK